MGVSPEDWDVRGRWRGIRDRASDGMTLQAISTEVQARCPDCYFREAQVTFIGSVVPAVRASHVDAARVLRDQ